MEKHIYKAAYAVKINPVLKERVQRYCVSRGLKQGYFVEKALQEQLAREALLEDATDLKRLKSEETLATPLTAEDYRKLDQLVKTSPRKTYASYKAFLKDIKNDLKRD